MRRACSGPSPGSPWWRTPQVRPRATCTRRTRRRAGGRRTAPTTSATSVTIACTRIPTRYPVSTPWSSWPPNPILNHVCGPSAWSHASWTVEYDERVVEARPQPHRPRDQARRRQQHTQVAQPEHAQVQPGRDPELGRDAARLVGRTGRQPAPSLDRAQQEADGHRDADRARRRGARAREPGQQRLVGFEQDERADREREEQRVGVARAVEEPTIRIEREAGDREDRGASFEPPRAPMRKEHQRREARDPGDDDQRERRVVDRPRQRPRDQRIAGEERDRRLHALDVRVAVIGDVDGTRCSRTCTSRRRRRSRRTRSFRARRAGSPRARRRP